MIDVFLHLIAFLSPSSGFRAAVIQVRKTCALNQPNALVLVATIEIFTDAFFQNAFHFILRLTIKTSAFD